MKKVYLAIVLILVFLAAIVADWNIRQETVQSSAATMIRTRNDDILEIEIGYPGGTVPPGAAAVPLEKKREEENRVPPARAGGNSGQGPQETPRRREAEARAAYYLYEVKSGDTFSEIAERLLGTSTRASEIMQLNGITDPRQLRAGTKIKIPTY
jgi:nucleoid-associated protein YgaU